MKWKGKMKGMGGGDGGRRIVSEDWWPLNQNCGDATVVIYNDACTRTLINAV
jgi:hypothetical protein